MAPRRPRRDYGAAGLDRLVRLRRSRLRRAARHRSSRSPRRCSRGLRSSRPPRRVSAGRCRPTTCTGSGGRPAAALVLVGLAVRSAWLHFFVRRPELRRWRSWPPRPFRLPVTLGHQDAFLLLPLYGVLAAAVLALAIRAWRGPLPQLPLVLGGTGRRVLRIRRRLAALGAGPAAGEHRARLLHLPVRRADRGRRAVAARGLAYRVARCIVAVSLASVFAAIGIWQVETKRCSSRRTSRSRTRTRRSSASPRSSRTRALRPPRSCWRSRSCSSRCGSRDLVASRSAAIAFLFAGLYFSYSQSSMAALFVAALSFVLGDRRAAARARRAALVQRVAGGLVLRTRPRGTSRGAATSGRTHLVNVTTTVIAQPPARRRRRRLAAAREPKEAGGNRAAGRLAHDAADRPRRAGCRSASSSTSRSWEARPALLRSSCRARARPRPGRRLPRPARALAVLQRVLRGPADLGRGWALAAAALTATASSPNRSPSRPTSVGGVESPAVRA